MRTADEQYDLVIALENTVKELRRRLEMAEVELLVEKRALAEMAEATRTGGEGQP